MEIEKPIDAKALPQAVSNAIKQKYPSGIVKKAEESDKTVNGTHNKTYEVKVEAAGQKHSMELDANGKPVEEDED